MNEFDQFDTPLPSSAAAAAPQANPFDQFDVAPQSATNTQQSDSQFYHNLGTSPNANFPNVKEEGTLIPREVTYNPDGTVDSTRTDFMRPLRHFATGLGDMYQQAENESTDTTPDALNAQLGLSMAPGVMRGAVDAGVAGAKSIGDAVAGMRSPKNFPTSDVQKSIFRTDIDAQAHNNDLYDWRDKMASGKTFDPESTRGTLDSVIGEASSGVPHPNDDPVINKLKDIKKAIGSDGAVPLSTLTDLDRTYNALYNRPSLAKSPILGASRGATKDDLDAAGQLYPEFGEAHNAASQFHSVWKDQFGNDVTGSFYSPDDTKNLSLFYNGKMPDVNTGTKFRAQGMMSNIAAKGPAGYQQALALLPEEEKPAFAQAFKDYVIKTDGNGRWNAFKNLLGDPLNSPFKKVADIAKPQFDTSTKDLLAAQKGRVPYDYNSSAPFSFDKFMDDSKASLNEMKDFQKSGGYNKTTNFNSSVGAEGPYTPLNTSGYAPRLALPSPSNTPRLLEQRSPTYNITEPNGAVRPPTNEEMIAHNRTPAERAQISALSKVPQSIPPTEIEQVQQARQAASAWDDAYNAHRDSGLTHKEAMNQIGTRPPNPELPYDPSGELGQASARIKQISAWDSNRAKLVDSGYMTDHEYTSKFGKRPAMPPVTPSAPPISRGAKSAEPYIKASSAEYPSEAELNYDEVHKNNTDIAPWKRQFARGGAAKKKQVGFPGSGKKRKVA